MLKPTTDIPTFRHTPAAVACRVPSANGVWCPGALWAGASLSALDLALAAF